MDRDDHTYTYIDTWRICMDRDDHTYTYTCLYVFMYLLYVDQNLCEPNELSDIAYEISVCTNILYYTEQEEHALFVFKV